MRIEQSRLPLSDTLRAFLLPAAALEAALSGGDDYRLAFTLPAEHLAAVVNVEPGVRVIGQVLAGEGICLVDEQGLDVTPGQRGYQHFRERP